MSRHGTYDLEYGFIPDDDYQEPQKPITNADRIRSMSDDELATFLYHTWNNASWCMVKDRCPNEDSCLPCWIDWLREESK